VARRTSTTDQVNPLVAVGWTVFAVWLIAPLAVGCGVLAAWLAGPDDEFAAALGATAVAGLISGLFAAGPVRRRVTRHRAGRVPTGL